MNKNISDIIEQYLKRILEQNTSGTVEIQRNELAELFQCVPSQINYVISTRFSIEQGYVVESKRGGGGYIRIRQMRLEVHEPLMALVRVIGNELSQKESDGLVDRLEREQLISHREAALLRAATNRDVLSFELPIRDRLRARLMSQMLIALFSEHKGMHD